MAPISNDPAEADWIRQAAAGDEQAFAEVVHAFTDPIYNLCYRMLGDPAEAEDAVQESFIKIHANLHKYDQERKFVNWALSIASNYCVDRLRRRRLALIPLEKLPPWRQPSSVDDMETGSQQTEARTEVQQLLGDLKEEDRAVVVLRYWHDLSYAEIAQVMNKSESSVKSRLHRARQDMAQLLLERGSALAMTERRRNGAPTVS